MATLCSQNRVGEGDGDNMSHPKRAKTKWQSTVGTAVAAHRGGWSKTATMLHSRRTRSPELQGTWLACAHCQVALRTQHADNAVVSCWLGQGTEILMSLSAPWKGTCLVCCNNSGIWSPGGLVY